MTREKIMEILQTERNKTKTIRQLKQTISALNSRRFDYFTVSSTNYDQLRVQGGLNKNEAESANFKEISRCEKELEKLKESEKEFWKLIDNSILDSIDKVVLLSYYYEGLTYREIAQILGYANHYSIQHAEKKAIDKLLAKMSSQV